LGVEGVISGLFDKSDFSGAPKINILMDGGIGDGRGAGVNVCPVQQKPGKKKTKLFPMLGHGPKMN